MFEELLFDAAMFLIAVVCLLSPERVQAFYAKYARGEVLKNFIQAPGYLNLVRFVGALALIVLLFMLFPLIEAVLNG